MLVDLLVPAGGVVVGAVIGSFGATAALRMAEGHDPVHGRSRCDGCSQMLGWTKTVPFAGYVIARGRCAQCGHEIDRFHLIGEGAGALVGGLALLVLPLPQGALLAAIGMVLVFQALVDRKTFRLPDIGNLLVAALCAMSSALAHRLVEGMIAASLAAVALIVVKWFVERRRSQIMLGLGDIKLICALALAAGQWTAAMVAGASLLALILALTAKQPSGQKLPFGPAIALSGYACLILLTRLTP